MTERSLEQVGNVVEQALVHALALQLAKCRDAADVFVTALRSGDCELGHGPWPSPTPLT
jgi:hypothetical protein